MPDTQPLLELAQDERRAAVETVGHLLPESARVSVYLFQPTAAEGVRADSPGVLWDVGPLPDAVAATPREMLYQCAEAGRTGSFLQSATECTRRVPQTSLIDRAASRSYRGCTGAEPVRRAQIAVEQSRHHFKSRSADGPPEGYYIHHLALAPSVQSFGSLSSGRLPVLGTIFTVTADESPIELHEYSNLVDYAIFIASELLEVRAEHLLGHGHITADFQGSALEMLLDRPTSDAAVQLLIKLLFAHHWFFPYDPAAYHLLARSLGDDDATSELYRSHGWTPPRRVTSSTGSAVALRQLVASDIATLIGHICWYHLGKEFRPRPGAILHGVRVALNTAVMLLCGTRTEVNGFGASRNRKADASVFLGAPRGLAIEGPDERVLAPVFHAASVQQLVRQHRITSAAARDRFASSFAVCGPGNTTGHTRTHLKPTRFVEGFAHGGVPRFGPRMPDREHARWLCSYAIARLAEAAVSDREAASVADDAG